jgi:uncharacterized protein YbjT (DUF2867 family)
MKSMSNENVVLVTGGTGSQGGATVTHLLAAKMVRVRVLTRNLESPKAKSLAVVTENTSDPDEEPPQLSHALRSDS